MPGNVQSETVNFLMVLNQCHHLNEARFDGPVQRRSQVLVADAPTSPLLLRWSRKKRKSPKKTRMQIEGRIK
jgi:hypothetical protein